MAAETKRVTVYFIFFPCFGLIMCLSLFTTVFWWISRIAIQIIYPFVFISCALFCSISRLNKYTVLLNSMRILWELRTKICQIINAEMWKIRIFASTLVSEELVIQDLLEIKNEIVDSQNVLQALNHELSTCDANYNESDCFRIKINIAIEHAEAISLKKIYKRSVGYVAKRLGTSEDYMSQRIDVKSDSSIN